MCVLLFFSLQATPANVATPAFLFLFLFSIAHSCCFVNFSFLGLLRHKRENTLFQQPQGYNGKKFAPCFTPETTRKYWFSS
ncbi:hypothetical protein K7X08_037051 [Anisodus acutangulus]|uniref:Uncharacterized protein n=1 Tax=Anisodus acutangulus TaxID=402998 RepID=A0A9Q1QWW7_9SOLA|nr:hypothetical protein K7X08_037051 [Anisodus acutangulus]